MHRALQPDQYDPYKLEIASTRLELTQPCLRPITKRHCSPTLSHVGPRMTGKSAIPPAAVLREALELCGETLRNIELGDIPLSFTALKASRVARLVGDIDNERLFTYEAVGYPCSPGGDMSPDVFQLALGAGRRTSGFDRTGQFSNEMVEGGSIEVIAQALKNCEMALERAGTSAQEAAVYRRSAMRYSQLLASSRGLLHDYLSRKYQKLKFSGMTDDVFSRIRARVDSAIHEEIPETSRKLTSAYENLQSTNDEDWSNATHTCRRILKDLADELFPPTTATRERELNGRKITVHLGASHYINRLLAFVEDHSKSPHFSAVVGSNLRFLGERLEAVKDSAHKGTHDVIRRQDEADRYFAYTYLLVGDLLLLRPT